MAGGPEDPHLTTQAVRSRKALRSGGLIAALSIAIGCLILGCGDENPDRRPVGTLADLREMRDREDVNVLFVLIDTLRADRLRVYGYDRETSPAMDYLALTGIRFAENRAQSSWTKSSMASLWTGLYPVRTGVVKHKNALAEAAVMPAELLSDAGFVTAGIWRNGWVAPNFGFSQGFEIYQTPSGKQAPASMRQEARAGRIDGTDIDILFSAIEFVRAHQDKRWFLYLHMMDVHQYVASENTAIFGNTYSDSYDNSILWTDSQLGELLMELYRLGLEDNTLIVVASDHGEAFGEHGSEGHARDLYQEVILTPLIISLPFKLNPPAVIHSRTQNVDIWPTVLEMLGIEGPADVDGISRVPLLLGEKDPESEARVAQDQGFAQLDRNWGKLESVPSTIVSVREGNLRLIHDTDDPERDQLFDIAMDPGESRNLHKTRTDESNRLRETARAHLGLDTPWEGGAPEVEIDEMHLRQLRALGYSIE